MRSCLGDSCPLSCQPFREVARDFADRHGRVGAELLAGPVEALFAACGRGHGACAEQPRRLDGDLADHSARAQHQHPLVFGQFGSPVESQPSGQTGVAAPGRDAIWVLLMSYTPSMSKVMISLPDDLLGALDAEAQRRHTSRSALLQGAARRELGLLRCDRKAVLAELDELSRGWAGPVDSAALVRAERLRDG